MHWKIGEFSRFTRVSVKMLRHYDELGLLRPAAVDPASGYRYYGVDQLPRLNRILALRDLGFGLEEVGALLDDALTLEELRRSLERRRAEIAALIRAEERRLAGVESQLRSLGSGAPLRFDVVLRPLPAQLVAAIRAPAAAEVSALFDELERYVAERGARAPSSPLMSIDGAAGDEPGEIEVMVPLTRPVPPGGRVAVRELPALAAAACVVFRGGYELAGEALQALLRWMDANGWRADGPLREVYLRFGADTGAGYQLPPAFLSSAPEEYVTELQLPLARSPGR